MIPLLAALACTPGPAPVPPAEAQPAVVLVVVDTVRADRVGAWGHDRPTSPVMDGLLAEAVRYERALAQAPWTTPSMGSLLASRYPSDLGIHRYRVAIPDQAVLLQEVFQEAGWATGAVVSHDYCGSKWRFDQGFDSFDESSILDHAAETSRQVTDRAAEFVDAHLDEPFFLMVHYFDPHFTYVDHGQRAFAQDPAYDGPIRSRMPIRALREASRSLAPADLDALLRLYDSELAHTDAEVGRLLDHLRARGRWERTALAWTADHGEEFGDHGRWGHTVHLYEESVHVPLVIRYPDRRTGAVPERAALLDLAPTLLGVAGLPVPEAMDGLDLREPLPADRPLYTETAKGTRLHAVVRGDLKLIRDHKNGPEALYDLGSDPGEVANLVAKRPEDRAALGALLDAWATSPGQGPLPTVEIDADERARLEALGYLEGE